MDSNNALASMVKILRFSSDVKGDSRFMGAGFLVDREQVITTAHVVSDALALNRNSTTHPQGEVTLVFLVDQSNITTAIISGWYPEEDVAVLKLSNPIPANVQPASLSSRNPSTSEDVAILGFPQGFDDGLWATAQVVGEVTVRANQAIQVNLVGGRSFGSGFSGAPIWDETRKEVLGMVFAAAREESVVFVTPSSILLKLLEGEPVSSSEKLGLEDRGVVSPDKLIRGELAPDALNLDAADDTAVRRVADDKLGFNTYVEALYQFITSEDTGTPLALAVDGPWGSGKSSLMYMLRDSLNRRAPSYPTIWFNAWKFERTEQIASALALEVMEQLKEQYDGYAKRIWFWGRLTWKRFSLFQASIVIVRHWLVPMFVGLLLVGYIIWFRANESASNLPTDFLGFLTPISVVAPGDSLLFVGLVVASALQARNLFKDPFQIPIRRIFTVPDYEAKLGFLSHFEEDFSKVVETAIQSSSSQKDGKVVIFIDDLDRCEPPKSADVIAAINLLLDCKGCIFVLGMDMRAVAASVEIKYQDLFSRIREENSGLLSPGHVFLEKFIQIPFKLPRPTRDDVYQLVYSITRRTDSSQSSTHSNPVNTRKAHTEIDDIQETGQEENAGEPSDEISESEDEDIASYDRQDVYEAIRHGSELLSLNPRQVKRFVNIFRLWLYIANQRGLLELTSEESEAAGRLTPKNLAVWLAWSLKRPEILPYLEDEGTRRDMREHLSDIATKLDHEGNWRDGLQNAYVFLPDGSKELSLSAESGLSELYPTERCKLLREREHISHWCHLPWDVWLNEREFRLAIKRLESLWNAPDHKGKDRLISLLNMTSLTTASE